MAQIKIIAVFVNDIQATDAWEFTNDAGVTKKFEAQEARTATCCLAEVMDGSGVRLNLELPQHFKKAVKEGDVLHVDCKDLALVDRFLKVRNVNRIIEKQK